MTCVARTMHSTLHPFSVWSLSTTMISRCSRYSRYSPDTAEAVHQGQGRLAVLPAHPHLYTGRIGHFLLQPLHLLLTERRGRGLLLLLLRRRGHHAVAVMTTGMTSVPRCARGSSHGRDRCPVGCWQRLKMTGLGHRRFRYCGRDAVHAQRWWGRLRSRFLQNKYFRGCHVMDKKLVLEMFQWILLEQNTIETGMR